MVRFVFGAVVLAAVGACVVIDLIVRAVGYAVYAVFSVIGVG